MGSMTPEMAAERAERRRRSGVRMGCIWSSMLLAGLLIYIAVYFILQHFNHRNWSLAINAAIREGNASEAAALLESCRQQVPALAGKAVFANWTHQVKVLQQQQAERRKIFQNKLKQMQQRLDSANADALLLNRELAEVARYAENESDLAQVRALQLRCEALSKLQALATAQDSLKELEKLQQGIAHLQVLQQQHRWSEFDSESGKIDRQLSRLIQQSYQLPEITRECEKLQTRLRNLAAGKNQAQQAHLQAGALYEQLLQCNDLQQAVTLVERLQRDYSQTLYAQRVKNLPAGFAVLRKNFTAPLLRLEQRSAQRLQQTREQLIADLKKLKSDHYHTLTCELVLQLEDNTLLHFETYRKAEFVPQNDVTAVIEFTTVDNRKIRGVFHRADGRGTLTVNGTTRLNGKLANTRPQGVLPDAPNIKILDRLITELEELPAACLPQQLIKMQTLLQEPLLSAVPLQSQLQQILARTYDKLDSTPQQLIFEQKLYQKCLANPPEWAGFVYRNGADWHVCLQRNYADAPALSLWLIDPAEQKLRWFGIWQNGRFTPYGAPGQLSPESVGLLAAPAEKIDLRMQIQRWQQQAIRDNLALPKLPEYLQL